VHEIIGHRSRHITFHCADIAAGHLLVEAEKIVPKHGRSFGD
jgi:hypothetical protein